MTTPTRSRGRTLRARLLALITDAVSRLTQAWDLLTIAQTRLLNALAGIRPGRNAARRIRTAVATFQRSLATFDRTVAAFAERWASTDLPLAYREGALQALEHADRPSSLWSWTPRHQETITGLTATYYVDLLARLREAIRRARAFLRAAVDQARRREGIDAEGLRRDHRLDTVVYAGAAHHPVHAWARSALLWQAVSTANAGSARTALDDLGCMWLEVRDGADCGWASHDDPDRADGTVRTVQDALAHPAAHPNCVREFLPRLDLVGLNLAGDA